ncbi:MAG: hypothetical protein H8E41_11255 [Desulfobulbaceae bacterium]|uniref:Uncharacterized protein n=1 Tax=Candidatus Desulfobia pelagia TaxID=2841692 RepID=A0A8J6NHC6_9BACT|nr:hypothetical protein [Candidatus Desulfobia pelagia]
MVGKIIEEENAACLVKETLIQSVEEALAAHFPGSPTVRIEGVDVDPGIRLKSNFGMG